MEIIFLKLGGSLITDKTRPQTVKIEVLDRACQEILSARRQRPEMAVLLGHGSGSFGHVAAKKHGTRRGVRTRGEWQGYAEVWYAASSLNRIVLDHLHMHGLNPVGFPPSAGAVARAGVIEHWDIRSLQATLEAGLIPVVFGDVTIDLEWGGTILSTEDIFVHIAERLQPSRLLLAGLENGIWEDFPQRSRVVPEITPSNLSKVLPSLQEAIGMDVTGGMAGKVKQMLDLIESMDSETFEVLIFSGSEPGAIEAALLGARPGTVLRKLADRSPSGHREPPG